ncbi:hypothetical protein [Maribacter aestuarii]|uniref:hypothetical protein n=1 Tax=Maribacter aestuarii TaxID=1130723 RepID=UPI0025A5020B|nr:hypothetical protein [Maribacter aestuarii]
MIFIKRKILVIINIAFFIFGCNKDGGFNSAKEQKIDFDKFTLVTPKDWFRFYPQGTDGFYGGLTNNKDTLYFDYGVFSFSSIDDIKQNSETIRFKELRVGGIHSKIVLEKRVGELQERFSFYSDKKDGVNLNRIYCYSPTNQALVERIFLSHRFK